jgi:uncharacterized cupredoxin-like copper-binding protein
VGLSARLAGSVLAVALAAAAGACGPPSDRTVEIRVEHSRFLPGSLEVATGQTLRFVIRNDDPIDHEFILGDEAVQRRHETGTEPHHGAIPGEVSVPAGTSVETTYTFDRTGTLLYGCHLPGHWSYGMRGTVTVG